MRTIIIPVLMLIFVAGCSESVEDYMSSASEHLKNSEIKEAVEDYKTVINEYSDSKQVAEAYFQLGIIYHGKKLKDMPEKESLQLAIEYFSTAAEKFPDHPNAPKALFTVGFIQANELENYNEATTTYNKFMETYPEHELVDDAQQELDYMGLTPDEILEKKLSEQNGEK